MAKEIMETGGSLCDLIEQDKHVDVSMLLHIKKSEAVAYGDLVVSCIAENDGDMCNKQFVALKRFNRLMDSELQTEISEQIEKLYGIFVLRFLYDLLFHREKKKKRRTMDDYAPLISNSHYRSIISALFTHEVLSQSELAKTLDISPQLLSKYLAKIKGDIVIAHKSPFDRKKTYYRLSGEFRDIYQRARSGTIPKVRPDKEYRKDFRVGRDFFRAGYEKTKYISEIEEDGFEPPTAFPVLDKEIFITYRKGESQ